MSLFPNEDVLTKEIESWEGFEYFLREENRIGIHQTTRIYRLVVKR
jgi:hypothetical protein